uniref:Uncharacterized protein n=1 Tax=Peronospora matthiolae TaxID=2874970 RepID=A0AAV1V9P5_9STRA
METDDLHTRYAQLYQRRAFQEGQAQTDQESSDSARTRPDESALETDPDGTSTGRTNKKTSPGETIPEPAEGSIPAASASLRSAQSPPPTIRFTLW